MENKKIQWENKNVSNTMRKWSILILAPVVYIARESIPDVHYCCWDEIPVSRIGSWAMSSNKTTIRNKEQGSY